MCKLLRVALIRHLSILKTNRTPFLSARYAEKQQFCPLPRAVNTVGDTIEGSAQGARKEHRRPLALLQSARYSKANRQVS